MLDTCWSSSNWAFRIIANLIVLLLVGIPILILYIAGKPFKRGFFCSDYTLRYPYHDSTVPNWALYSFCIVLPLTIIITTECAFVKWYQNKRRNIKTCLTECYNQVFAFLFGAGCTQLLTDIAKYTIGRLRPHFFDVCAPNIDCNDIRMKYAYIEQFECRGRDDHLLKDMRLSFPSGHSSLSAYSMIFLVLYCHAKFSSNCIKHIIQYFAIVLAVYTGLSRVSDYKHHWSDVFAGLVLGTATAMMTVVFVSELFSREKSTRDDKGIVSQSEEITLGDDLEESHRKYTVI